MQKLSRGDVTLALEVTGDGEPALVFVHGWTCDHTYFVPQVEHFSRARRVVTVDLPGHGESDKPEPPYSMEGFADDVAWLCRRLELRRPVIVGHSMGGVIALALATRHPDVPAAIVALDSPWHPNDHVRTMLPGLTAALNGAQFREAQRQLVRDALFLRTDDARRRQRIVDLMSSARQDVMASAWEHTFSFDTTAAISALRVPALYIGGGAPIGQNRASVPIGSTAAIAACNPDVVIGQTVCAGHFIQFDAADQVNAMIERFLTTMVRSNQDAI